MRSKYSCQYSLFADHVMISVFKAPFLWTGLPAPILHQASPRCVLLLPPAPLGDVGLPLLRAAGQALPPGCRHVCAHTKPGPLQSLCTPQPLLSVVLHRLCAHGNAVGTCYSPAVSQKIWDIPIAAAPLLHKSSRKFSKHGSSTVERRAQVLHMLNCSIHFQFNPQSILSNPQHFLKAWGVEPPLLVF